MDSCIQLNKLSAPHAVTATRARSVSLLEFSRKYFYTIFARLPHLASAAWCAPHPRTLLATPLVCPTRAVDNFWP